MEKEKAKNVEIDADTGDEIVYFIRRGKPVLYLRDRLTKRFIRRLRYVRISVTGSVEYEDRKRPYHNIYIDITVQTDIPPREFPNRYTIATELERRLYEIIDERFGTELADMVQVIGIEFGSKRCYHVYPRYIAHIAWQHHSGALKSDVEVGTL